MLMNPGNAQILNHEVGLLDEGAIDAQCSGSVRMGHLEVPFYGVVSVVIRSLVMECPPSTLMVASFITWNSTSKSIVNNRNAVSVISFSGSSVRS
jgi:hypothetical protein